MSIGTGWERVRVGVLFSIGRESSAVAPNCKFYVGLCNGTVGTVGQNNTSGFVGVSYFSNNTVASVSGGATMTVTLNGPTGFVNAGTNSYFFTKSGSFISNMSGFGYAGAGNVRGVNHSGIANPTGMTRFGGHTLMMVDFQKSGTNFVMNSFGLAQTTVPTYTTNDKFENSMFTEFASIPFTTYWTANNYSYNNAQSTVIPKNPISSGIDTVNILGFNGTNSINIYNVRVWRFA
jgi:hypothetical protein